MPARRPKTIVLGGGENHVTPDIRLPAGVLKSSLNYESAIGGGYRRMSGYERFDGHIKPSQQTFWTVYFDLGFQAPQPLQVVVGSLSLARAILLVDPVVTSGDWASGDAAGYLVLTQIVGEFRPDDELYMLTIYGGTGADIRVTDIGDVRVTDNGDIRVVSAGASSQIYDHFANATSSQLREDGALSLADKRSHIWEAANTARLNVGTVPGSGPVRGVCMFKGRTYAFRDNATATAGVMHVDTADGWEEVALNKYFEFDNGRYTWRLDYNAGTNSPVVDEYLVGEDSGTSFQVLAIVIDSGSFATNDAVGYLVIAEPDGGTGSLNDGENIDFVAGRDDPYAVADAVTDGAQKNIRKFERGDTIHHGNPVVGRFEVGSVQQHSGSFVEGNAKGVITVKMPRGSDVQGLPESLFLDVEGSQRVLVGNAASPATYPEIAAGGHYDFRVDNFFADPDRYAMYGVNGVSKGFEYSADGVFTLIHTQMDESPGGIPGPLDFGGHGEDRDKPKHLTVFADHLWYIFEGGSLQHSSLGLPIEWNSLTGAGEVSVGDEGVGLTTTSSGGGETFDVLIVHCRNRTRVIYGTSIDDFVLRNVDPSLGAIEWTIQDIGQPRWLDDRGLSDIQLAVLYGNLQAGTFSEPIDPFIKSLRANGVNAAASIKVREKNHHRVYFNDKSVLTTLFDNRGGEDVVEFTRQRLGFQVFCGYSGEDESGGEVLLAGGEDGYVYQLDVGRSFDGEEFEYAVKTIQHFYGSSTREKRLYNALIQVEVQSETDLSIVAEYDGAQQQASSQFNNTLNGAPGLWSQGYWERFVWRGAALAEAYADVDGICSNMGLIIGSRSKYDLPHTLKLAVVDYEYRRYKR